MDKVEVRKSNIQGYGVFAKEDISKGSIVTYYDGKILPNINIFRLCEHDEINDEDFSFMFCHDNYMLKHYQDDNCIGLFQEFDEKKNNKLSKISLYGYDYEDIMKSKSKNYGSLINDGSWKGNYDEYSEDLIVPKYNNNFIRYLLNVYDNDGFTNILNNNCCIKRDTVPKGICKNLYHDNVSQYAIIATKDIKKDEELLMYYGTTYWKEKEARTEFLMEEGFDMFKKMINEGNIKQCRDMLKYMNGMIKMKLGMK